MLALMKSVWRAWKGLAHRIIKAQNWILMAWVYCFAVAPVALVLKLIGHSLVRRPAIDTQVETYWEERRDGPLTMDRAARMF